MSKIHDRINAQRVEQGLPTLGPEWIPFQHAMGLLIVLALMSPLIIWLLIRYCPIN